MNLDARLVKTAKGDEELKLRTHGLGKNERLALILVDGHSTAAQVVDKASGATHLVASLEALVADGFVDVVEAEASGGYDDLKRQLVAVAHEVFGKKAAKVVAKIEAAPDSIDGLTEGVSAGRKIALLVIDVRKAGVFAARCQELLAAH